MLKSFKFLVGFAAVVGAADAYGQLAVYDNLAPSNWDLAYPSAQAISDEIGDEVVLSPASGHTLTSFSVQYFTDNTVGNDEFIRVRFYENNGPDVSGAASPGGVIYDSGNLAVAPSFGRKLLTLDLSGQNVNVPAHFTWTVEISGIGVGERAGLAIHGPATVGSSQAPDAVADDYWENLNQTWSLRNFPDNTPSSFGAQMTIVPEPGAWALCASLGLLGFAVYRQRVAARQPVAPLA